MRPQSSDLFRSSLSIAGVLSLSLYVGCSVFFGGHSNATRGTSRAHSNVADADSQKVAETTRTRVIQAYGKLSLRFEANEGQVDPTVKFLSRGSAYTLFLTGDEAVLALKKKLEVGSQWQSTMDDGAAMRGAVLRLRLLGSNHNAEISGLDESSAKTNYFIGSDPKKWHVNVTTYARVRYRNVYPGIDLIYHGNHRQLEYDFVVAPRADPGKIIFQIGSAEAVGGPPGAHRNVLLRVDANGDLVAQSDGAAVRFHKPVVYQEQSPVDGRRLAVGNQHQQVTSDEGQVTNGRQFIDAQYALHEDQVHFKLAPFDPRRPLVIDPILSYSTYLGGDAEPGGQADALAVDGNGSAYITGSVGSPDFPTTNGALQTACAQAVPRSCALNGFVAKLNPEGTALVYSTYLGGGTGQTFTHAIAVDGSGHAYVTGSTSASDYPTTPAAYQPTASPHVFVSSAFVSRLSADGSALVYSTYLGDSGGGSAIAVDGSGSAYVAGSTTSLDFPVTLGAFQAACKNPVTGACRGSNVFVSKLNPAGASLIYSTYLGGSSADGDSASGIAIDSSGDAYITGATHSADFPTTPGAFQTTFVGGQCALPTPPPGGAGPVGFRICSDAFVTKLDPSASNLVYSTFLAGSMDDAGAGIAVDASGDAYVTGTTASPDYPTTPGAFQVGAGHMFVTKLDPTGSALLYSMRFSGSKSDSASGIALDASGDAFVTGQTLSTDFPTVSPIQAQNGGGSSDAFVTAVNTSGTGLLFSTYLGGSSDDSATAVGVDEAGNAYVAGHTDSTNFPVTSGTLKTASHIACQTGTNPTIGYSVPCGSMFVTKIGSGGPAGDFALSASPVSATITAGQTATYSVNVSPIGGFHQAVTLSCSGAPQGASCSVSPTPLTMNGSAASVANVTVTTTARSAAAVPQAPRTVPSRARIRDWPVSRVPATWLFALGMLAAFALVGRRRASPLARRQGLTAAMLFLLLTALGLLACGGASSNDPPPSSGSTPQGTYSLSVTGTSASGSATVTHDAALTLKVN